MAWIEIGGTDIHYVEQGSGRPIVFLHGFTSCAGAWFQQFEAFRDKYRCIAYDSVNHGHSSNSPRDEPEPDRADELEDFLAALGISEAILAGNSMGAMTLLRWAVRHPRDAKALIPSGMGVNLARVTSTVSGMQPLDDATLFLPVGDSLTEGFREEQPRMFERYVRVRSTATRLEASRHPRRFTAKSPGRDELADGIVKLESPMLAVCGSLDRLLPAVEELHELVPSSRLEVIEGAPHNVYYEAAAEYNRLVAEFLAEVGA